MAGPSKDLPKEIPKRLAHYRLMKPLGAGGMGEVYLAQDTKLERRVAVKILPPHLASDPERLTSEGRVFGTVAYMSPEQVKGKRLDPRSDIFSLGVLLYEMTTGHRPFSGETPVELMSSILRDTPPSVTEIRDELPDHLGRTLRRCLEKDPNRRCQSALDLRNELEDLRRELAPVR